MNITNHRFTASTYIFEEEPIFSDSDEEQEYVEKILATQNRPKYLDRSPNTVNIGVQCSLSPEDLKMDIGKRASANVENVKNGFKPFVNLKRELEITYKKCATSQNQISEPEIKDNWDWHRHDEVFPSKYGNVGFSHIGSYDSGISNVSSSNKSVDGNEDKENTIRKSTRKRRRVNFRNLGTFITRKHRRQLLNKTRADAKRRKSVKEHSPWKTLSSKKSGADILKVQKNCTISDTNNVEVQKIMEQQSETSAEKPQRIDEPDLFQFKSRFLPKKQLKALARNWMKPKKNPKIIRVPTIVKERPTFRRLYSPETWLHSKELANLCMN